MNRSRPRRLAGLFAAVMVAAAGLVGTAGAATADTSLVTCTGTGTVEYDPALTLSTQTVTASETDDYTSCLSTDPTVTSGSAFFAAPLTTSCLSPLTSQSGTYVLDWNNGQSSTMSLTVTVSGVGGQLLGAITGTVTSGLFSGGTVTGLYTYLQPGLLDCLTGLDQMSGPLVLTIV